MTRKEWEVEGRRLFGPDIMRWRFVCPACGTVQSVQDYKDAGAPSSVVAFSCVGRYIKEHRRAFGGKPVAPEPCDYPGDRLF